MNFIIFFIIIVISIFVYYIYVSSKQNSEILKRQKAVDEIPVFKLYKIPEFNSNAKIIFHLQNLKKAIIKNDINLANLTYAKIIELVRQENFDKNQKFNSILLDLKKEYKEFRKEFELEYPENFLAPWEQNRKNSNQNEDDIDPEHDRILEIHFDLNSKISNYYKERDSNNNLEKSIDSCKKQIEIGEKAKKAFELYYQNEPLPYHLGFSQLSIILEKQNKYKDCIDLCIKAKAQGWNDDWDKRITRVSKKIKS